MTQFIVILVILVVAGAFIAAIFVDMTFCSVGQADAEACHTFGTGPTLSSGTVYASGLSECSPVPYSGSSVTVTISGPTSAQGTANGINASVTLKVPCKPGKYTVNVTGTFGSYNNSATFSC